MTDSHDPNPLDELASAHLDGQTTAAEAAQVDGDPALAARVAALDAVRAAVRADLPPVDADRREASIAAALDAFDAGATDATAADPGRITPIAVAARRRASRRSVQVIGAVAVAVLLALAVPLLGVLDSDSPSDDVATSVLEEATAQDSAEPGGGDGAAGAEDALVPGATAFALPDDAIVDLGSFEDLDALAAAVHTYAAAPPDADLGDAAAPSTASGSATERAAAQCADAPATGSRVLTGTATLEGRPVLVFVDDAPTGERTVTVVDAADCSVIASRQLD
jgi:hypothetical protein